MPAPDPRASVVTPAQAQRSARELVAAIGQILTGHEGQVTLAVAALFARGHVLLEDVPGVGKTTLAQALAKALSLSFSRVQFTSDMLPSDVLGVQMLDATSQTLVFRRGPLFAQVVLADEINRASPKTQSAMLEAMAERRITVDDATYPLPEAFWVMATQNPLEHHGAYPLPESQLDRFMVRLHLGYPPLAQERELLRRPEGPKERLDAMAPLLDETALLDLQRAAAQVALHEDVADYLLQVVGATRTHPRIALGVSPRGALALGALARSLAMMAGREFVLPEDVKRAAAPVMAHRLTLKDNADAEALVAELLAELPVPR
jgi:MoxR-like ATPase